MSGSASWAAGYTLGLALAAGCVGAIDGAPDGAGVNGPPGMPRPLPGANPMPPGAPPSLPGGMGMAIPPGGTDPGRVAMRRLNRTEYNNTVRDLLGTKLRPADAFEADRSALGFDNNGDVQTLSPLQVEQYQTAAETLVEEALLGGPAAIAAIGRTQACDLNQGAPCLQQLVAAFARRAWRRPPATTETARLLALASEAAARGEDALGQLAVPLTAVLSSPHFLFRVELDADRGRGRRARSTITRSPAACPTSSTAACRTTRCWPPPTWGRLRAPEQVERAGEAGCWRTPGGGAGGQLRGPVAGPARAGQPPGGRGRFAGVRSTLAARGGAGDLLASSWSSSNGDCPVTGMLTARFTYVDDRLAGITDCPRQARPA